MSTLLKPCPKCGGTNIFVADRQHYASGDLLAEAICDATEGGCGHCVEADSLGLVVAKWNAQEAKNEHQQN